MSKDVPEKRRFCARCGASITSTDESVGFCTQCHATITTKVSEDDDNDNLQRSSTTRSEVSQMRGRLRSYLEALEKVLANAQPVQ